MYAILEEFSGITKFISFNWRYGRKFMDKLTDNAPTNNILVTYGAL